MRVDPGSSGLVDRRPRLLPPPGAAREFSLKNHALLAFMMDLEFLLVAPAKDA